MSQIYSELERAYMENYYPKLVAKSGSEDYSDAYEYYKALIDAQKEYNDILKGALDLDDQEIEDQ